MVIIYYFKIYIVNIFIFIKNISLFLYIFKNLRRYSLNVVRILPRWNQNQAAKGEA